MTPEETVMVLKLFETAWDFFKVDQYTPHVWAEACDGITGEDALTAAKRLIRSEDRPPSIARFREECKLVTRNRQATLPPGPRERVDRDQSARFAAALSRGLKSASDLIPKHDHHHGWENCPACSTADARRPAVEAAIRSEFDAERNA